MRIEAARVPELTVVPTNRILDIDPGLAQGGVSLSTVQYRGLTERKSSSVRRCGGREKGPLLSLGRRSQITGHCLRPVFPSQSQRVRPDQRGLKARQGRSKATQFRRGALSTL